MDHELLKLGSEAHIEEAKDYILNNPTLFQLFKKLGNPFYSSVVFGKE